MKLLKELNLLSYVYVEKLPYLKLDLGGRTFWSTSPCLDPMPLLKEIFDTFRFRIFSTLDLCFGYHQLLLGKDDKVNTTLWGI